MTTHRVVKTNPTGTKGVARKPYAVVEVTPHPTVPGKTTTHIVARAPTRAAAQAQAQHRNMGAK